MPGLSVAAGRRRSAQIAAKAVKKAPEVVEEPSPEVIKARNSFSYFCKAMGLPPARHMREWHEAFLTGESNEYLQDIAGPNTVLLSPRGPLDPATPVATPEGWKPFSDIKEGDTVYAVSGGIAKVVGVVDYPESPCWRVVFSDGASVICDESHRWDVGNARMKSVERWKTMTLQQLRTQLPIQERNKPGPGPKRGYLMADPSQKPWIDRTGRPRYRVPMAGPVRYPHQEVHLEPYLLGALIGASPLKGRPIPVKSEDPDVLDRIASEMPRGCRFVHGPEGEPGQIEVDPSLPEGSRTGNSVAESLKRLGLWGKARKERFIPKKYLIGSVNQRIALLQGLLDTMAYRRVGHTSGELLISTPSIQLAQDIDELVRSLGGLSKCSDGGPWKYYRDLGPATNYRLSVRLPEGLNPFHCRKKGDGYVTQRLTRTIVDIQPVEPRPVRCIQIDDRSELFICADYVAVKNSAKSTCLGLLAAWLIGRHALEKRLLRILYVSYNVDVARNKSRAIKQTISSKEYQEIFPMVRLGKDRTSDELWSIDFDHAGIKVLGEDAFTIACAGLKGTITSKRSSLVIIDDAIKSAASIANPEIRREMESNWNNVIVPTMFQGARAVCLGTRFHFDDLFATTFTERRGWKVITQAAIHYDEDGRPQSYWPAMWSTKYLLKLQADDPTAFAYQYLNRPVRGDGDLGISPALFIKGEVPDEYDMIGVGVDLSAGMGERNDWTVFTLAGRVDDKVYVIDYRRMKSMGNLEKIEAMCELLMEWNLLAVNDQGQYFPTHSQVTIWPEAVAYQSSFEGDFRRMVHQEMNLHNLRISPVKGFRGDKLARLRGIIGLFQGRRVIFNKYRDFSAMVDEVVNFGHCPHDDCADSLNIVLQGLMRRGRAQIEWQDGVWSEGTDALLTQPAF